MELKSEKEPCSTRPALSFNRTAYGIEMEEADAEAEDSPPLLIAPLMELKYRTLLFHRSPTRTFNRTAYGIEMF